VAHKEDLREKDRQRAYKENRQEICDAEQEGACGKDYLGGEGISGQIKSDA
jgi:hypothetical protein